MQKAKNSKAHSNSLFEAKDLLFIWKLFLKNIIIIVLLPIVAYVVGYIYAYRLNNIYGVKAQLLLKSNETYDYQDPIYQGLGAYAAYTDIQNQMRILKSRDLIGEVIDKINVTTSYFVVGRLKRHEVFGTLPFTCDVIVRDPELFEKPINVVVLDENTYRLTYEKNGEVVNQEYFFDKELVTDDYIINLKRMYSFEPATLEVIQASEYEIAFHSRDYLINKYQSDLTVENIEFTSILNVLITDRIEQRATVFLDTLTDTYIDYSKRVQLEVNQNTLENIQRQIDTVRRFIEEKELSIINYREQNKILNITKEEEEFFTEYVFYSKQKRDLEEKYLSIVSLESYLSKSLDDRVLPPYFYIEKSDSYLSESIGKLRTKQTNLEIKLTQESEDNPNVTNLKKEITMLQNDLRSYLSNLKIAIEKGIAETEKYIAQYRSDIKDLPKSAQDILNIQRELDVNNKMYLFLLEKKTNTLIARAGIIPQVRVIEQTVSLGVIEPDKQRIRVMFLLGGFILALIIAIARKLFFERLETVAELSEVTSISIIGGVPYVNNINFDELVVNNQPKSQVTESFRTIRTNLNYLGKTTGKAKKIIISSYFPGEGKTFCSTNTAGLIAKGDKKVLVIDFDLHKPRVHKAFGIPNDKGLSTYLSRNAPLDSIIINIHSNLDVITAGPIPPNPSELILKERVAELIATVETTYDYVIIDTPPFGLLHDAIELIQYVDIFVVILNARFARKSGVRYIEDLLEDHVNISKAIVLNGIRLKKIQYYYSKYTYKYGYGYGKYGYGYGAYGQDYNDYTS